jgi:hypothetical protein
MSIDESTQARFWAKVQKTETCWLWTASLSGGYGNLRLGEKTVKAHRLSWELHVGEIPDGLCVCHNCPGGDNPKCVNPTHLFLGTKKDNTRDAVKKGRWGFRKGSTRHVHKLTEAQVQDILRSSLSQTKLGQLYGVTQGAISHIFNKRNWTHVTT